MRQNKNKCFSGRIIFDHLPKTAGQAVNSWLKKELGNGCVTENLIGYHNALINDLGGLYSIISGHITFEPKTSPDPRYQYITCFREPVDRVISWLFFVINNHTHAALPELYDSVSIFLTSEGAKTPDNLLGYISNCYFNHFLAWAENNTSKPDEETINVIFKLVKNYDAVGLFENMPRFLDDVADLIYLPRPQSIDRVNVTHQRPPVERISNTLRQRIIELNQHDIILYQKIAAWKQTLWSQTPQPPSQIAINIWEKYNGDYRHKQKSFSPQGYTKVIRRLSESDNLFDLTVKTNQQFELEIEIGNTGTEAWDNNPQYPLAVSYHWYDLQWQIVIFEGKRTPITAPGILTGGKLSVMAAIVAPTIPGSYILAISAVKEHLAWFDAVGSNFHAANLDVLVEV